MFPLCWRTLKNISIVIYILQIHIYLTLFKIYQNYGFCRPREKYGIIYIKNLKLLPLVEKHQGKFHLLLLFTMGNFYSWIHICVYGGVHFQVIITIKKSPILYSLKMEINKSCFQYLYEQKQLHLWNAWHIFLSFKFTDALLSSCHAQLLLWWGQSYNQFAIQTIHNYSQMPTIQNSFVVHKMVIRWLLQPSLSQDFRNL